MENLKKARKAKGLTAQELAKLLNYSTGTINKYEQGFYEPDIQTLLKLSKILDCSVDYLIGNDEGITITKKEYNALKAAQESLNKAMEPINNQVQGQNVTITRSNNNIVIGNSNHNENKKE